jgi:guanylate kinase
MLTEWDYVLGNYYGTDIKLEDKIRRKDNVVLQVLGRMALRLKRRYSHVCTVMLLPSDQQTLDARLRARGYGGTELAARLNHGQEELTHAPLFDYVVPDADIMTDMHVARVLNDFLSIDRDKI